MVIEVEVGVNNVQTDVKVNSPVESTVDTPFVLPPHNLGDHKNVNEAGAALDAYLRFDGTNWIPGTPDWLTLDAFNATPAAGITSQQLTNWDTAYSWGNHAAEGYLIADNNLSDLTNNQTARNNLGFPSTSSNQVLYGAAGNLYQQNANFVFDGSRLGVGLNTPTSTLHVKGASSSAGDAFFVQNGAVSPVTRFRVANDGTTNLCHPNVVVTYNGIVLDYVLIGGGGFRLRSGNTLSNSIGTALQVQSGGPSVAVSVATAEINATISDVRTNTSPVQRYSGFSVTGTINNTGSAPTLGFLFAPTVTAAGDLRAFEATAGKVLLGGTGVHSYLVLNRLTTTQRDALVGIVAGSVIYNTTANVMQCYDGTTWQNLW